MAQKHRNNQNKRRFGPQVPQSTQGRGGLAYPPDYIGKPAPSVYGKAFIVLEDQQKNTFVFSGGAWTPHDATIAECRERGQVKELPQRLNKMTRYEVRYAT